MSDHVTDEMVETAARASYTDWAGVLWGRADDYTKRVERSSVRAALEAAAPLIAAATLHEAADDIEAYGYSREWAWTVGEVKVAIRCAARLRARADRIEGGS